ncbi:MAG TPA: cation-transporting P-type ATPase [Acidimicrobiales bacterium]|nr:cation-transporting P-type ATPase [Acidimicrobiales bacterium]
MTNLTASAARTPGDAPHAEDAATILARLGVKADVGLSSVEAVARLARSGPNRLPEAVPVPAWRRLAAQLRDLLTLILVAAAVISFLVSGELKTPVVVLVVVAVNAVIGFVQENRAEASLAALRTMLVATARVRRDGQEHAVAAEELVVGDVVVVEAGDRIPADGRLLVAHQLEVEEAALTGESVPSAKSTSPVAGDRVGLGDRRNMAYMNTTVTRGRGEMVVTATALDTEIGHIADLLRGTADELTPLQHQLHGLARSLAGLAGVIVALVVGIGLLRGQTVEDLLLTAVALAVASIPEGLPAVTAVTLAIGVSTMAKRNAIVKRLAGVETLGCTSVICTDKTGTLTLNQMTARQLVLQDRSLAVSGEGYAPVGAIDGADDLAEGILERALAPMALCSQSSVRRSDDSGWALVGDPTDGALVVLASKGGLDVAAMRAAHPRLAEVPFDSSHKLAASVHEWPLPGGGRSIRLLVEGAPDQLLARATHAIGPGGFPIPIAEALDRLEAHNERVAGQGLRVLAVADRELAEGWRAEAEDDPLAIVHDLTVVALVGILDPPRPQVRSAIATARRAGVRVTMITGDHAATAIAIGRELGLADEIGRVTAMTGAEIDAMTDAELADALPGTSVFARVSPEHKLRLVAALQAQGHVVAMTGDGVNDAPALKRADIGIAMGITGTEVTKEAATMVLTDDDFATIVQAVQHGRGIYDNIVKFVRFQLSTTLGFAALFLGSSVLGLAGGKPFGAISILWVNIIMDGPPAMALGLDPVDHDVMERQPRPRAERILTRGRWVTIGLSAAVMAAGTLTVLALAPGEAARAGVPTAAGTMAFNTFVLFQFFNILNARSDRLSVFRRQTLTNAKLWWALGAVAALQVGTTHLGAMRALFDTTTITSGQWLACVAVASSVVWVEEARKLALRLLADHRLIRRACQS